MPVRRCIKEDKIDQILSIMQTGRNDGMVTMDQCLEDLVVRRRITFEDGIKNAEDKKTFETHLKERGFNIAGSTQTVPAAAEKPGTQAKPAAAAHKPPFAPKPAA